ncbi:hypothetical protein [uncultured Chryseobacterium sp.]|uniref:hypothetical protein n=1 Tax=uncultured Chryseobacterium sp. TaxID=259322 RepID=UPI0025F85C01|nr:hypothetical protein [uncultured Chryseobacterium sp.]
MQINHKRISEKITGFQQRWDAYYTDDKKVEKFKQRCLNSFSNILGYKFISYPELEDEFCYITGIHEPKNIFNIGLRTNLKFNPQDTFVYKALANTNEFVEFLFNIEAIILIEGISKEDKDKFIDEIIDNIQITSININAVKNEDEIIFYPRGAKLLDDKLVNDNLKWLKDYPDAHKLFKSAVRKLEANENERNIIDDLRLSIELFLKSKLQNSSSLENQLSDLGNLLKEKNIGIEIRNLFVKLIDYYSKYQNNNIKHNNTANKSEVEFILYLTATFIRFLITI